MYVDNKGEQEGKQVSMFYYHCEALINNKDMFEVKKFPLLLQLLIKSNIFSNLSKLRNYTSSLMKINFRQIIQ